MEIILLRHAQPDWLGHQGHDPNDPGLTELGRHKAEELSASLGRESFDSIQVSPYRRSQETAKAVLKNREFETQEWLREIRLPSFERKSSEQVSQFFKTVKARPLQSWWDGIPGGEPFREFQTRISQGLLKNLKQLGVERMRPESDDDRHLFSISPEAYRSRHLIVSHLGTSGLILSELLHIELVPWIWESFTLDWNGIVRLETAQVADGYVFCLRQFNENGHRDPSLGLPKEK